MSLEQGQILQQRYRVVAQPGAGGMGAVYRVWDTRLNVAVAVKEMLPQPGLDSQTLSQLRMQFRQEAVVLARLNHPNLVNVTDFFEEGGNAYLVMRFIEGESLAERIARAGALPEAQVVGWANQLLHALAYCHGEGIIHRDIKPQNVIIRPDGSVILVDFGLVKLWDPRDPRTTQTAVRGMGTPEYAPPEQYDAGQGHTDPRSDLYSLGATLYHALSGLTPPTVTQRIVNPQALAPLRALRPHISSSLDAAIQRALALQPNARFQSAQEMARALVGQGPVQSPSTPPPRFQQDTARLAPERHGVPLWAWIGGGGLLALLVVVGLVAAFSGGKAAPTSAPTPSPETEAVTVPPEPVDDTETPTPAPHPVTDTPAPTDTFTPAPTATFTPEPEYRGRIVFTRVPPDTRDGNFEIFIYDLDEDQIIQLTNNGINEWLPAWSPDGRSIAFSRYRVRSNNDYDIWVMDSDGANDRGEIVIDAWDDYPVWSPDGSEIAFISTGITSDVPNSEVFVSNRAGTLRRLTYNTGRDEWPDWSPDGRRLAVGSNRDGADYDIYLFDTNGDNVSRWASTGAFEEQPAWSPDGEWLAFIRKDRDTNGNGVLERRDDGDFGDIWIGRVDGSDFRQLTFDRRAADPAWSPDGRYLVFTYVSDSSADGYFGLDDMSELWVVPVAGGEPAPLLRSAFQDTTPDWGW